MEKSTPSDNTTLQAVANVIKQEKNFIRETSSEMVQRAVDALEEIAERRRLSTEKLIEGRNIFTALVNKLAAEEIELSRRAIIHTATLSTVETFERGAKNV